MTERNEQHQMGVLLFILGFMAGGIVSFFFAGALLAQRISQYELINKKLLQQNKRLVDSLPEETRKQISGSDVCVCCGKPIPEGEMVCTTCMRKKM